VQFLPALTDFLNFNRDRESVSFRNAIVTLMSKLFTRIWIGVNQVAQKVRRRGEVTLKKNLPKKEGEDPLEKDIVLARENHEWMLEVIRVLFGSIYPGAPFERRCTALELLNAIADSWKTSDEEYDSIVDANEDLVIARTLLRSPYHACTGKSGTNVLLGALVDTWEKLRVTAFDMLQRHPSPLTGMETPAKLERRLEWALELLRSPRVRESGAAALLIRLLVRKYAYNLNWNIQLSPKVCVTLPASNHTSAHSSNVSVRVLNSLCDILEHDIDLAERDVFKACQQSLAHGPILLAKHALREMNLNLSIDDPMYIAMKVRPEMLVNFSSFFFSAP